MVRFGKIIAVDAKNNSAVIRESSPFAREYVVLPSEYTKADFKLFEDVAFTRDEDFRTTRVAKRLKVTRI